VIKLRTILLKSRLLLVTISCVLLSACAGQTWHRPAIPPLENIPSQSVADVDILGVSEQMKDFVDLHVPPNMRKSERAFALAYATLNSYLLGFRYDPTITLNASEAFSQRVGNCLTFSNMLIALAREAGLEASYQEVKVPQIWNSVNETLLVNLHVNAIIQDKFSSYVVDISTDKPERNASSRKIPDRKAKAQFYNNLGVGALIDNDLSKAHAYFVKAIETAPEVSYVWSNLGVVYRRNAQDEEAKLVYLEALKLNPGELSALSNLYTIYEEEGDLVAAENMQSRVERYRQKNPYYLYYLSSEAAEEQRYADAIKLIKRAIKIEAGEYRFHVMLARSQFLNGDIDAASMSLDHAKKLAPDDSELDTMGLPELVNFSSS